MDLCSLTINAFIIINIGYQYTFNVNLLYSVFSHLHALSVLRLAMVLKDAVYVCRVRPCHEIWAFFITVYVFISKSRKIKPIITEGKDEYM